LQYPSVFAPEALSLACMLQRPPSRGIMTTKGEEIHAERRSLQSTEENDCFLEIQEGAIVS
jgi:hypothetical protein